MSEEFRHHLELRTEEHIRRGLNPGEAARRARIDFGHIESRKVDARASRGLWLFDEIRFSWLDVKLGLRMLRKYPGLSAVALIGMSVATTIGAGAFGFISSVMDPTLPLPEGERIVSIQNSLITEPGQDRQTAQDFLVWRDELKTVQDLAAFTTRRKNLAVPGGGVELVGVAEITPSGFRAARTAPVLGRPLLDEDSREGAPLVLVIAYEEWQRRFGGDAVILGREVRLGRDVYTIVGVMPERFRFPVNHRFWIPLRLHPTNEHAGAVRSLFIFGRLADGATIDRAQAEITPIGLRMTSVFPETHQHLRPKVLPYTYIFFGIDSPERTWALRAFQMLIGMLLVVVAVNVAILVYARTAMRAGEIAVRTALGASRKRIITQLFAEALVLSGAASVIGLAVAGFGLTTIGEYNAKVMGDELPFWLKYFSLSPSLVAYVSGLAILGAVIIGVLPALKATGRRVQARLQQLSSGSSQMQLGRSWTMLIVAQVAIAVAMLPLAIQLAAKTAQRATMDAGYPIEEFVRASLSMEQESDARFTDRAAELIRRLQTESDVVGVTFATDFPGGGTYETIEIEGAATASVWTNRIDPDLFKVFDVPILAGRGFVEGDVLEGSTAAIVDRVFADKLLGGSNVLGRRIRYAEGPWLEVVGVVPDFTIPFDGPNPKVYRPATLAQLSAPIALGIRVRHRPASTFIPRFREVTAELDPTLQLEELRSALDRQRESQQALRYIAFAIGAVTLSVVLLSAAGIYAMMSFTVARRRREIGIRTALGADRHRVLASIFARATAQLGTGVLVGLLLAFGLNPNGDEMGEQGLLLLPLVALLMMTVGLLAALGPARRGLSIQPSEALREE